MHGNIVIIGVAYRMGPALACERHERIYSRATGRRD